MNCGVLNAISLKKVILKLLSRGASMRTTRSSKYSLTPLKAKYPRMGRTERVEGGGRRLAWSGQDRGDWNLREKEERLVNVERAVTIVSGEMYPEWGISLR
jgi:hypothetical protein